MKSSICSGIIVFAVALLAPQIIQAQGAMTYLSNLGQASIGSAPVGSDSWLLVNFTTGTNSSGYVLNFVQLGMLDASGNPGGFMAMLYSTTGGMVGTNLDTLNGSLNPTTAGIYTFTPTSTLILAPLASYSIVLTAGISVTNGAYSWSESEYAANLNAPYINGSWSVYIGVLTSNDGLNWRNLFIDFPQYAINATAIPEPSILELFGLGGFGALLLGFRRRKSNAIQRNCSVGAVRR